MITVFVIKYNKGKEKLGRDHEIQGRLVAIERKPGKR
jgi:hypothetical protein